MKNIMPSFKKPTERANRFSWFFAVTFDDFGLVEPVPGDTKC
jgi:hypothetical protein